MAADSAKDFKQKIEEEKEDAEEDQIKEVAAEKKDNVAQAEEGKKKKKKKKNKNKDKGDGADTTQATSQ